MPEKTTKNFRIFERQDEWLNDMAEAYGTDRSKIVRRALDFYDDYGVKHDKVLRKELGLDDD